MSHVALAAANEPFALEAIETVCVMSAAVSGWHRHEMRDGPVTLEHDDGTSAFDVCEVAREAVLELADLGLLHIAKLAKFGARRQCRGKDTARGSGPATGAQPFRMRS